ncbi:GNAT family N-acetyltransferase [Nocardia sp. NPDC058058]|uniref:GNAT family N-acetyltransferase n=1 Tax=Nocardia sp. NPDC058058 TaxID=3346317 RepID=UPI0036DCC8C4
MNQLPMLSAVAIAADRVLLRKARAADHAGLIELQTDPEIWTHLKAPRRREDVEHHLAAIGGAANATTTPGHFVIADKATDTLLGTFEVKRRAPDWPGHVLDAGNELELGYLMRRETWGAGLAFEAATAALRATAAELPDQPVLIVTRTANKRSLNLAARLGFEPFTTFDWFDADQTLCLASLHSFKP